MKIEYWSWEDILPDGTTSGDTSGILGAVNVEPRMDTNGNHHLDSSSSKRDGHWLMVTTGRLPNGVMHGITIYFDNEHEMQNFEQSRVAYINLWHVIPPTKDTQ